MSTPTRGGNIIGAGGKGRVKCGYSSRTARDQHQPASSRATAVLATTGRLRRASKPAQRACSRRLARSPRSRAPGVAWFCPRSSCALGR